MARKGIGFFDTKGHFFRSPEEATVSDLSALLGKIGEGESLAPGIAATLLQRREEIERLFAEHDVMMSEFQRDMDKTVGGRPNVSKLPRREAKAS